MVLNLGIGFDTGGRFLVLELMISIISAHYISGIDIVSVILGCTGNISVEQYSKLDCIYC